MSPGYEGHIVLKKLFEKIVLNQILQATKKEQKKKENKKIKN